MQPLGLGEKHFTGRNDENRYSSLRSNDTYWRHRAKVATMVLILHLKEVGCSLPSTVIRDGYGIDSPHSWVVVCHPLILTLVMQTATVEGLAIRRVRGGDMDGNGYIGYWIRDYTTLCFLTGLAAGVWDMELMINGIMARIQRM